MQRSELQKKKTLKTKIEMPQLYIAYRQRVLVVPGCISQAIAKEPADSLTNYKPITNKPNYHLGNP